MPDAATDAAVGPAGGIGWEAIRHRPDLTLRELKAEFQAERSVQMLCTALKRMRLTVKKALIAGERERPDGPERREALQREQRLPNPQRLAFIDETWA